MISDISICNKALSQIGSASIASLTEDSPSAKVCKTHYGPALDALLEIHDWGFATKYTLLAELTICPPVWGHAYQRPADCLRVIEIVGGTGISPISFEIAQKSILTNHPNAWVKYIARISDPAEWPAGFADAFAWDLSARIVKEITGDASMMNICVQMAGQALAKAKASNNKEYQREPEPDAPWIRERQ